MARLISRKQVEEVQDFIRDASFAQSVSISGSLLVSQSFDLGSDPSEKSTITNLELNAVQSAAQAPEAPSACSILDPDCDACQ